MSQPFVGEVRIFGFSFAPRGWALCSGQLLPISQNTALFSILGTTYGGNGTSTFGLPNLQGRAPMHWGQGPGLSDYVLGEIAGSPTETLLSTQLPAHTHTLSGATPQPNNAAQLTNMPGPTAYLGLSNPNMAYSDATSPLVAMSPLAIGMTGGSQPHNNLQPLLTLNFCIALQGVYPARN